MTPTTYIIWYDRDTDHISLRTVLEHQRDTRLDIVQKYGYGQSTYNINQYAPKWKTELTGQTLYAPGRPHDSCPDIWAITPADIIISGFQSKSNTKLPNNINKLFGSDIAKAFKDQESTPPNIDISRHVIATAQPDWNFKTYLHNKIDIANPCYISSPKNDPVQGLNHRQLQTAYFGIMPFHKAPARKNFYLHRFGQIKSVDTLRKHALVDDYSPVDETSQQVGQHAHHAPVVRNRSTGGTLRPTRMLRAITRINL